MAMSVNPTNEKNLSFVMGQRDPAAMIRPRSTVPIRASGHLVPRQQAGHMTASDQLAKNAKKPLPTGGHPHMTGRVWRPALFLRADPALVRDVEDDAVGVAELLLVIERVLVLGQVEEELAAGGLDVLPRLVEVVDDEAEMMGADIVLAALLAGGVVGLVVQQRQVDRAVRQ